MPPTASTRVFALLGNPVAHSLSPVFQNAAMRARGHDAIYVALRCESSTVASLIRALCHAGGGGNVTIPHKAIGAEAVTQRTAAVIRTGALNTFWLEDDAVCGDNTDVAAVTTAAAALLPSLSGTDVLLVGAGGAATAAACALLDAGAARITVLSRSVERARLLAERLDPDGRRIVTSHQPSSLAGATFDLAVNASSLGMRDDDPLPLDLEVPTRVGAALDLVYRRADTTPWIRHARKLDIPARDGIEVLLAQGAMAFSRWFGEDPPLQLMRDAIAS